MIQSLVKPAAIGGRGFVARAWRTTASDASTRGDWEKAGHPAVSRLRLPQPRRSPHPYTPRCVCDTIFPQAMVAGPGSKPSASRYIQRCCLSKEVLQAELILTVGTVTSKKESAGPSDCEGPRYPSLPLHCHRRLLSSPEPFRLKRPKGLRKTERQK